MSSSIAGIRAAIEHPVVDADGHVVESLPVLVEYIAKVAGVGFLGYVPVVLDAIGRHRGNQVTRTDPPTGGMDDPVVGVAGKCP